MKPITGVINSNCLKHEPLVTLIDNGNDIAWKEAIKGKSEKEIEDIGDSWESNQSIILFGFKDDDETDTEQPFSAIIDMSHGIVVQIVHSDHVIEGVGFCSPCYPGQGDLESEGSLTAFSLPPEYFEDNFNNKSRITKLGE